MPKLIVEIEMPSGFSWTMTTDSTVTDDEESWIDACIWELMTEPIQSVTGASLVCVVDDGSTQELDIDIAPYELKLHP